MKLNCFREICKSEGSVYYEVDMFFMGLEFLVFLVGILIGSFWILKFYMNCFFILLKKKSRKNKNDENGYCVVLVVF